MTSLKIAIAIATAGRRDLLAQTVRFIARQTRLPNELLICPAKADDFDAGCLDGFPASARVVPGSIGSSAQRNALIEATNCDVIVFFDDDFLPAEDFLEETERIFANNLNVAIVTGEVLADGAVGPGLDFENAVSIIAQAGVNDASATLRPVFNGYGCNMAARMTLIRRNHIRFDENLPLYAWLEDVDFSRQLAPFGDIVRASRLRGVHMGTKRSGRTPGRRLGYSQVANQVYLMRKWNMSASSTFAWVMRNVLANLARSFLPEPWVDRRGRLTGNMLAFWDLVRGRVDPRRMLDL